ncbi:MAG: response regulator transcription factor [Planctomycetales bacterium]|nr:response regulator transcription factor [Planctomycetales bacterium]
MAITTSVNTWSRQVEITMTVGEHLQDWGAVRVAIVDPRTLIREGLAALLASTSRFRAVLLAECFELAVRFPLASTARIWLIDAADPSVQQDDGHHQILMRIPPDACAVLMTDGKLGEGGEARSESDLLPCFSHYSNFELLLTKMIESTGRLNGSENHAALPLRRPLMPTDAGVIDQLTAREIQVLKQLASGRSGKDCSRQLNIAPSTFENHKANIMKKLRVNRSVELVRIAIRSGLIEA